MTVEPDDSAVPDRNLQSRTQEDRAGWGTPLGLSVLLVSLGLFLLLASLAVHFL